LGFSPPLWQSKRFLAFGFLLAGLSSYGQTFLIGFFEEPLRLAFGLSSSAYGLVYSGATLVSGISLFWAGRIVDRYDLRTVTLVVLLGAALGAILLASAVSVVLLALAFVVLRLCGQGLLMHTAQTTMGRYFDANRGKAVSIATLGLPTAEAVMPSLALGLSAVLGWRGAWLAMAAVLVGGVVPLALYLLRGHGGRRQELARQEAQAASQTGAQVSPDWRRRDVLRDRRFYALLPAMMAAPFIVTALFFHQGTVAEAKGWSVSVIASSFPAFAGSHMIAMLLAGPLVDRVGARRLVGGFLLPMTLALVVLMLAETVWAIPIYLALAGLSMGSASTLMGALWPELYGTTHLGAIRALVHAVMVFTTAGAPIAFGIGADAGVPLAAMAGGFVVWNSAATALAVVALRTEPPSVSP